MKPAYKTRVPDPALVVPPGCILIVEKEVEILDEHGAAMSVSSISTEDSAALEAEQRNDNETTKGPSNKPSPDQTLFSFTFSVLHKEDLEKCQWADKGGPPGENCTVVNQDRIPEALDSCETFVMTLLKG